MINFMHSIGFATLSFLLWMILFVIMVEKPNDNQLVGSWTIGILIAISTFCLTL